MESLNYFSFQIQSNIYGLSCLPTDDETNCIIVATLERQIFCIEKFSRREVHFTYIPNGADIISIDAFKRSSNKNDFVIGITFVKTEKENSDTKLEEKQDNQQEKTFVERYYFNIYASLVILNDLNLEHIAQDCQTFEIDFVPYHLYHTELYLDNTLNNKEPVWLLSGSDRVHTFREDKEKQCFYEQSVSIYFPELCELPSIVLWIDIYNLRDENDGVKRLTAIGCENGEIKLSVVEFDIEIRQQVLKASWKVEFDGPVLSVRLFTHQSSCVTDKTEFKDTLMKAINTNIETDKSVHLLVVNSIEASVVYRDIIDNGLSKRLILPNSRRVDCTTTSCIADIDMDGRNEIAIGTYGHELLVYKYEHASDSYVLWWEKVFPHPIQSIAYVDLTGDGLKELLVLTNKGLHVLQHNLENTLKLFHNKVRNLIKRLNTAKNLE